MKIHITNKQKDLTLSPSQVENLVNESIAFEGVRCDEVSVYFVTTKEICRLHKLYFNDPSPTDCISFPLDEDDDGDYRVLGDIFVCPETAKKYALENHVDPFEELSLYIVHGLLHLMGYDDIEKSDIQKMRKGEKLHIDHLKSKNLMLYPVGSTLPRREGNCS